MLPLCFRKKGTKVRVGEIKGGHRAIERLNGMGIYLGVEVTLLKPPPGPVLVKVGNSRIALGFGLANKIFVEVLDEAIGTKGGR